MNYMKQVAEMLGVELEEEFRTTGCDITFRLTEKGCEAYAKDYLSKAMDWRKSRRHIDIIEGICEIIKIPKFPKEGTWYWCVLPNGTLLKFVFSYTRIMDIMNFKTGNFFLTREEITEEDIVRIVAMLNSPESLV